MSGRRGMLAAALVVLLAAACGSGDAGSDSASGDSDSTAPTSAPSTTTTPVDDTAGIKARLIEQVKGEVPDLAIESADCPDGPPEGEVGAAATCSVRVEGVDVPFTVTLLADNPEIQGGAHNYEVRLAKPMVDVTKLVSSIRNQAATQLKVAPEKLAVDCGPAKIQVVDVGAKLPCTVVSGGTTRRLIATVTDEHGSVQVSEPAPPKG